MHTRPGIFLWSGPYQVYCKLRRHDAYLTSKESDALGSWSNCLCHSGLSLGLGNPDHPPIIGWQHSPEEGAAGSGSGAA